jgi:transcriptional regulator with XRE-family HTH domain
MLNPIVKDAGLGVLYAGRMETMGDRIRQLRIARGLTQPALGELCGGVTKSAVSQWEDGSTENIKLKTFIRLCEVLQTDPQYLIWGPDRSPTGDHGLARGLRKSNIVR